MSELDPSAGPPPVLRAPLRYGETLLMTTDGVTEARDARGVFFPLARTVADAVAADPGLALPGRLVDFVRESTLRHSGGHLTDDTTVFAVRRIPPAGEEHPGDGRP
jgi:serine phosphatase RsbU (regulator of sigma subunit)